MKRFAPLLFLLYGPAGPAGANDSIAGVSAGGIVLRKTDAIAMKKEVLTISHQRISVDYEFVNESAQEVEETIVFPLPPYPVVPHEHDSYYGQPSDFSIQVNGRPVAFRPHLVALLDETDVTDRLRKIGLTDLQIAYNPAFAHSKQPVPESRVPALTAAQERQLRKAGLYGARDGGDGPLWQVQVNYVWKQRFPVNQVVRVHHAYRPFNDAGPGMSYIDKDFVRAYCADKDFFAAHDRINGRLEDGGYAVEKVGYILTTGNNWKRGIEDFTLNIRKGKPDEIVTLCFPGKFKKIDPLTYQIRVRNFRPTDDLRVYFGNVTTGTSIVGGVLPKLGSAPAR